jgi:glutaredoxin
MTKLYLLALLASLSVFSSACGNPIPERSAKSRPADVVAKSELVTPPFELRGEAEGLLLVWYDAQGEAHTATNRNEVPAEQRASVRVDALELAPEKRLDSAFVYVADLSKTGGDGRYPVRKVAREAFEAALASVASEGASKGEPGRADVIVYGASWCGACQQAKQYFTQKGVPFVEKDIEKEPSARTEMLAKAKDQGVNASGIPVIDVRGRLVGGFNPARIEQLLTN